MSYEIVDAIYIKRLQQFDQYNKLINPIQIKKDANKTVADLMHYQKFKYGYVVNSFSFNSAIANDTIIIFIACNRLNDANEILIMQSYIRHLE